MVAFVAPDAGSLDLYILRIIINMHSEGQIIFLFSVKL